MNEFDFALEIRKLQTSVLLLKTLFAQQAFGLDEGGLSKFLQAFAQAEEEQLKADPQFREAELLARALKLRIPPGKS